MMINTDTFGRIVIFIGARTSSSVTDRFSIAYDGMSGERDIVGVNL